MEFKGTIIITDPCYIDPENILWNDPGVDTMEGFGIEKYGFTQYIWENTIYGDWSCTTYEVSNILSGVTLRDDDQFIVGELGEFCADAGLVGVFLLDEVLAFNPDFMNFIREHPHCVTVIENFEGNVEYLINDDDEAYLEGIGTVNFVTEQTGA